QDIRLQLNNWCNARILSAESQGEEANITPEQIRNQTRAMTQAAIMAAEFVNDTANFVNDTNLLIDYEIISMNQEQIKSRSQHEAFSIVEANQWMAFLASGSSKVDKDGKPVQPTPAQIKYQTKLQFRALLFAFTNARNDAMKRRNAASAAAKKERKSASAAAKKERKSASAASAAAKKERKSALAASAAAKKERQRLYDAERHKTQKNELERIKNTPEEDLTSEDIATLEKAQETRTKRNKRRIEKRQIDNDELERIKNTPMDDLTPEDIATLERIQEKRTRQNMNQNKRRKIQRENSYTDGEEGIAIKDFGEHDVPLGPGMKIMDDIHSGYIKLRNIIARLLLSPDELSTNEVARKAVMEVDKNEGRFLAKHPDRELDRFYPVSHERAAQLLMTCRVETVMSSLAFDKGWEEYVDKINQKNPLLSDESIPSLDDLKKEYVEAEENEDHQLLDQVVEKIEKYLFPQIFCPSSSNDHYYHCSPQDPALMQRTNGDICLIRYSDMIAEQWHQFHLDPIHVLPAQAPRRYGASVDLLWCHTILPDCLHHGISNAMQRGYMTNVHYAPQTKSTSIYLHFVKRNGGPNWNLPPHALPGLQRFRVTDQPVKPDFILEIKLGPNGLFDQATQIWLVMVDGHACNIQLA
ncbi:predicted protein, partial [Chaetoceros tenuissimus]